MKRLVLISSVLTLSLTAQNSFGAVSAPGVSMKREALIWALQSRLQKFVAEVQAAGGQETKQAQAFGTSVAHAADALTTFYSTTTMTRTDALILTRLASDFTTYDNSAIGAEFADLTRKQAIWNSFLKECPTKPSGLVLQHQEELAKFGFNRVTQDEVCQLKEQLRQIDEVERNGNG